MWPRFCQNGVVKGGDCRAPALLHLSAMIMLRRLKDAVSVLNVCGKPWPAVLHAQTLMGILVLAERLQTKTLQAASLPQAWYYGQLVGSKSNPGV